MTQGQQKQFVKELIDSVHGDIRDSIELGRVPEDWDGHELRQLLADKFSENTMGQMHNKRNPRRRSYDNTRLVNNL